MNTLSDISVPLGPHTPIWPGRPPVRLVREELRSRSTDAIVTNTELHMDLHAGTHIDTPAHVSQERAASSSVPLDACIGPALVLDARGETCIDRAFLERHCPVAGVPRLLFRTHNGEPWLNGPAFTPAYLGLDESAAEWALENDVRLVGIDNNSVQSPTASDATHLTLLKAKIVILEGLDLSRVQPGPYDLICLPISIPGADGLPARAVLAPRGTIR